jgi:hypothetical protein
MLGVVEAPRGGRDQELLMETFAKLWLAIPVSAAAVWFWSFLSWAVLPIHSKDWAKLPDEDGVLRRLREANIPPGHYGFPKMTHAEAKKPEMKAKWEAGPTGVLTVWRQKVSMPANMALTFGVFLAVSFLTGYVASETLPPGASFARVMQIVGTIGVVAYTFSFLPNMIWFQASRTTKLSCMFDGVVMGLIMGAVFAAMWPAA